LILISQLALLVACGQSSPSNPAPSASGPGGGPAGQEAALGSGSAREFGAFQMEWRKPTSAELATRAQRVSEILLGATLDSGKFVASVPEQLRDTLYFQADKELSVAYYPGADDLRVSNSTLLDDITSPKDVGSNVARAIFEQTFEKLADAGLVDRQDYDVASVEPSKTITTLGSSISSTEVEVVNTYDFLLRRSINGIPFMNAGIRVNVHRGGQIAGIRLGGAHPLSIRPDMNKSAAGLTRAQGVNGAATPTSLAEVPAGSGYVFSGSVDAASQQKRFTREQTRGLADRSGVYYMLPLSADAKSSPVVEPLFIFSYSNLYGDVASRRRYIGYSLRDPAAPPVDLSEKAEPDAKGDAR
jgi:hypothetical protein